METEQAGHKIYIREVIDRLVHDFYLVHSWINFKVTNKLDIFPQ